ncbi:MAG: peptidoglycan-binding protein [Nitrosomonas sp.]|nr:peptidoglycan-binding protein [Nitrosomonas sp.]
MRHELSMGSRGEEVNKIKSLLNERLKLNPKLAVSDIFDKETDRAVKLFQLDNYLGVSGEVDAETYAALETKNLKKQIKPSATISSAKWMSIAEKEIGQEEIPGNAHNSQLTTHKSLHIMRQQH